MKVLKSIIAGSVVILTGCAGSADHAILTSYQATDTTLNCAGLQTELVKAQMVIDGVNKDQEDISGADVMDGILWFPFNLIAKSDNYEKALSAAGERVERLEKLKKEKGCKAVDEAETKSAVSKMAEELKALNQLRKDGALTEDEYSEAKRKVLNGN